MTQTPFTSRQRRADDGFTLAEAIVAFGVLVVVAVASTMLVVALIAASRTTQLKVTATNLAQQDLAEMRELNARAIVAPGSSAAASITSAPNVSTTVGNTTFTLNRAVQVYAAATPSDTAVPGTACSSSQYRLITTTVSWPNARRAVTLSTRLGC